MSALLSQWPDSDWTQTRSFTTVRPLIGVASSTLCVYNTPRSPGVAGSRNTVIGRSASATGTVKLNAPFAAAQLVVYFGEPLIDRPMFGVESSHCAHFVPASSARAKPPIVIEPGQAAPNV